MAQGFCALVCGASGLVGSHVVRLLADDPRWERIDVLTRRPLAQLTADPRVISHEVRFERLEEHAAALRGSHVFCALGTTRKLSPAIEQRRWVDRDIPLRVAGLARGFGARVLVAVSSVGADPHSRSSYLRIKGELEQGLRALAYASTTVVRPSVLLGERSSPRPLEAFAGKLCRYLPGRYRAIEASLVARAKLRASLAEHPGFHILEGDALRELATSAAG